MKQRVFDAWSDKKRARARDVLRRALKIISVKKRWAKGSFAVNAEGNPVLLKTKEAVAFCALGAVSRVGGGLMTYLDAVSALNACGRFEIMDVNDIRGHAATLARFRKAIAALAPIKR